MSDDDYSYHVSKKVGKVFVSKRLASFGGKEGADRIASKVIDSGESTHEALDNDRIVLRRTAGGRQEIVAKFHEDDRRIHVLTLQRWSVVKGWPHEKIHFSFVGSEIEELRTFLDNIARLHFPNADGLNVRDDDLQSIIIRKDQAAALLSDNIDLVIHIAENDVTERDLIALGYRRKQLKRFELLLEDAEYFSKEAQGGKPEAVWQAFFEANRWIFGYGLSYIFMDSLDGQKLEQAVRGFSIAESGKRADALMKTRAEISSMCLVEIKRHDTPLVAGQSYRSGVWPPSHDLSGGIAQVQETVRAAISTLSERFRPKDETGAPTGEEMYGFEPRSYLVIGRLSEFSTEHGVNEEKFRSFETFRRNIRSPEILTFDELLHRARFIVDHDGQRAG